MKEKITTAIYTRVSTREQVIEGYSLDAQERLLIDFCRAKKYNIYRIYSGEGISAKDIKHRPGMLAIMSLTENYTRATTRRLEPRRNLTKCNGYYYDKERSADSIAKIPCISFQNSQPPGV